MDDRILYEDGLVTVSGSSMIFHQYYLNGGDREVPFDDIREIEMKRPNIWNGKWRIWGTGNFRTWFPLDNDRPRRDKIFVARLKSQWAKIGFTVRDSAILGDLLRKKGLVRDGR